MLGAQAFATLVSQIPRGSTFCLLYCAFSGLRSREYIVPIAGLRSAVSPSRWTSWLGVAFLAAAAGCFAGPGWVRCYVPGGLSASPARAEFPGVLCEGWSPVLAAVGGSGGLPLLLCSHSPGCLVVGLLWSPLWWLRSRPSPAPAAAAGAGGGAVGRRPVLRGAGPLPRAGSVRPLVPAGPLLAGLLGRGSCVAPGGSAVGVAATVFFSCSMAPKGGGGGLAAVGPEPLVFGCWHFSPC